MAKKKKGWLRDEGFRPSAFPKLELCIHYQGNEGDKSEAASRGDDHHHPLAAVLAGEITPEQIEDPETRNNVMWAVHEIYSRGIQVQYVEYEMPLTDAAGNVVTSGKTDGWGTTTIELWVFDAKTGDEYDYAAQFAAYAKSVMEEQKCDKCVFLVLYLDLRKAIEYEITYAEACERIYTLHERFLHREEEQEQANEYCDWCARRGECPVWLESSGKALAFIGQSPDLVYQIEQIKKDPQRTADFYVAYRRLVKLFNEDWQISDVLLEHLKSGARPEGVTIGHRSGDRSVDPEQALLKCYHALGSMRFARAITVSASKLQEIWQNFTRDPLPLDVTTEPDIYFPKLAQPKGRGKARALREKRVKEAAA